MKSIYEVTYYNPSLVDPYGRQAAAICQKVANTIPECGYPNCNRKTIGCAVHETSIKTQNGYKHGCQFLPVCKKHKDWEYTKLEPMKGWGYK